MLKHIAKAWCRVVGHRLVVTLDEGQQGSTKAHGICERCGRHFTCYVTVASGFRAGDLIKADNV